MIIRIEEFVQKKANLDRIVEQFTVQRDRIFVLKTILGIVDSSAFSSALTKEEKDKITELNNLATSLSMVINDT